VCLDPPAVRGRIRDIILDGYQQGLGEEGFACDRERIACGMDGALAIRSVFTALPLHRLTEPVSEELDNLIHNRLQLTRYLCDLGLVIPLPANPKGALARTSSP
jgi:hypothetical protein